MRRRTIAIISAIGLLGAATVFAQTTDITGFRVVPNGNMGIGTTDPQARLHIAGDTLTEGVYRGKGVDGLYPGTAVLQSTSTLGKTPRFVIFYDDLNHGNSPQAIQITNVDANVFKTFIIPHPTDNERYLVHASIEGPEGGIYYRGTGALQDGKATIQLPDYFEALARAKDRTVQLTTIGGFDQLAILPQEDGSSIRGGQFTVYSNKPESSQRFHWEVKAVRADAPRLVTEPKRDEILVGGVGPYTYEVGKVAANERGPRP